MPFLVSASAARSREGGITRSHYVFSRQHDPSSGLPHPRGTTWSEAPCILVSSSIRHPHFYFDRRSSVPVPAKTTNSNPPHWYHRYSHRSPHCVTRLSPKDQSHWFLQPVITVPQPCINSKTHQPYMCAVACPAWEGVVRSRTDANSKRHCLTCSLCSYPSCIHFEMVPVGILIERLEAQQLWDQFDKLAGQQEQRKELHSKKQTKKNQNQKPIAPDSCWERFLFDTKGTKEMSFTLQTNTWKGRELGFLIPKADWYQPTQLFSFDGSPFAHVRATWSQCCFLPVALRKKIPFPVHIPIAPTVLNTLT